MKKLFVWILSAALCVGLTACADMAPSESHEEEAPENGVALEETLQTLFAGATGYDRSAGASLRNAQAACNLLSFAERVDYANISPADREKAVSGAYSAMSDEQREEFLSNFDSIRSFMESAFGDYDSARPLFDDAGVANTMDALLGADNAREQWDALAADIPSPTEMALDASGFTGEEFVGERQDEAS